MDFFVTSNYAKKMARNPLFGPYVKGLRLQIGRFINKETRSDLVVTVRFKDGVEEFFFLGAAGFSKELKFSKAGQK